ncbi:MAG: DUF5995 family protein [Oceanihabitans sp.]
MPRATTIQNVLEQLDAIISESITTNSRMGLFAYVYRRTTAEIAAEIEKGSFEDNQRLEIMDVAFANLYLDAYHAYKNNKPISAVWAYAFNQTKEPLTILQHILLGMNAHINLDLAIATATTMAGKEIKNIEADFNKVNDILYQITNELQDRLSSVSPLMFLLDLIGKNSDEKIIDFSMRKAREQSWNSANLLWALGNNMDANAIKKIDLIVLKLSKIIKDPNSKIIHYALRLMHTFETKQVSTIIKKLQA